MGKHLRKLFSATEVKEVFHGRRIALNVRKGRDDADCRIIEADLAHVRELDKTYLARLVVGRRGEDTALDDAGLHAGENFRLSAHLEYFYVTIGLQARFFKEVPRRIIGGGGEARDPDAWPLRSSTRLIAGRTKK